jgi:thiol:disulfide interchange protein
VAYPEHEDFKASFQPAPLAVYGEEFVIGVRLGVPEDTEPGDYTLAGELRYQACNDTMCAFPKKLAIELPLRVVPADQALNAENEAVFAAIDWPDTDGEDPEEPVADGATQAEPAAAGGWRELVEQFDVTGKGFGYMNVNGFLAFLAEAEDRGDAMAEARAAGEAMAIESAGDTGFLAGRRWWAILGLVLAGGLALNLTPCVLPLIPINIAIIGAGARAGSRARGFALGGAYGLGITLVYGALGLLVVLGLSSAFGSINANPYFNLGIAALFVVLGLAMFDVIMIDFSKYQAKVGVRKNESGRFGIALFMGSVSALLAGACVAPVVIYTIVYAQELYNTGMTAALALPFLLGVGMALPWPFAGAGLSFLPKPGMWMVRVKQAFGVFILAFAAYYGYESYKGFSARMVDPAQVEASVAEADEHGWVRSLEDGLARAAAENRPVLVDFWATWCKSCLTMNSTTLKDDTVLEALEDYVKIKYQAEDPSAPGTAEVMEHFNVLGLPTYLVLQPKAEPEA